MTSSFQSGHRVTSAKRPAPASPGGKSLRLRVKPAGLRGAAAGPPGHSHTVCYSGVNCISTPLKGIKSIIKFLLFALCSLKRRSVQTAQRDGRRGQEPGQGFPVGCSIRRWVSLAGTSHQAWAPSARPAGLTAAASVVDSLPGLQGQRRRRRRWQAATVRENQEMALGRAQTRPCQRRI